jgi:HEAT repeat protein
MSALLPALQDKDVEVWYRAATALAAHGTKALEPLLAALGEKSSNGWAGVICALGQIRDARAVEPLLAVLRNKDWKARVDAISLIGALGEIRDPRAIEALLPSLQDACKWVRLKTVYALGNIGEPRVIEPLLDILHDSSSLIRRRGAEILTKLGCCPEDRTQQVLLVIYAGDWKQATKLGAAAVGTLLTLMGDPDVAGDVVKALSTLLEQDAASISTEDLQTMTLLSGLRYFPRPDDDGDEDKPLDCSHLQQRARELLAERQHHKRTPD